MCTDSNSVDRIYLTQQGLKNIKKKSEHFFFSGVSNLIGKGLSCRESRYRIEADLTRKRKHVLRLIITNQKGKVAIGRARYLLNIVF
jgi:hypothetical protein